MAEMDLPSDELSYDFGSRSNPYYHDQSWAIALSTMDPINADPRPNMSPIAAGIHGLRQTTMAEHPMMGDWHFQQMQMQLQHQQQQQEQQTHHPLHTTQHHPHQHPHHHQQHIPRHVTAATQAQSHHHHHYHHSLDYSQQHSPVMDTSFGGVFHTMSLPPQLAMAPVSQAGLEVSLPLDQSYMTIPPSMDTMYNLADFRSELVHYTTTDVGPYPVSSYHQQTSSPTGSHLEILSQPSTSDEHGWTMVDGRTSFE